MVDSAVSYRYFVTDLLTNQVVAELPLTDVSYSKALKDAGEMSAKVSIGPSTSPLSLYANTMPGKSGIYVMRNGECVWGGIIWSRDYDIIGKTLNIQANEFTSYLHHRKIWKTWDLEHDGTLVYLDKENTDQYIIELNPDTNDRVSLPENTAVEIVFLDAKGYRYSGHYRVNKDLYNAKKITVDAVPLQSTYPPILNGNQAYTKLPTGYKVIEIKSREVKNGSSEVIIETDTEHQLAVGDVIDINGLDGQFDSQNYATTYATRTESYKMQAVADSSVIKHRKGTVSTETDTNTIKNINTTGIKIGAVFEQDGDNSIPGIMPSIFLTPPTTVVSFTQATETFGTVTNGSDRISGLTSADITGYKVGDTIHIVSGPLKTCKVVNIVLTEGWIYVDKKATGTGQIRLSSNTNDASIVMSRNATRSGDLYGTFTNQENGFSHKQVGREAIATKTVLGTYEFSFTVADDSDNPDVRSGKRKSWKDVLKVGDYISISGVLKGDGSNEDDDFFGNTYSEKTKYKIVTKIDKKNRRVSFEEKWLTTVLSNPSRFDVNGDYIYPTASTASNAQFSIVDVTRTPIAGKRSDTATCLNGKEEIPVIKVISKTKFVVDPGCNNSPYDETAAQTVAEVKWKREYQANIHTHTDTYDQVRYLLTNVFEDFIHLEYLNPFLGNLEKYQIRTAKYDPATDLANLTTGFIKPVYSKEIKTEQEITGLVATLATGTNAVTLTTGNTENLKVGQLLTKSSGTGAFGNSGVVYVKDIVNSAKFTVGLSNGTAQNHATAGSITFGAGDLELVAVVGLSTPYSQFILPSENNESNDINEEIIVSGNDQSINGVFKIKSISADKTKITYVLPEQTDTNSRIKAIFYPSVNDNTITFGKHNLVDGSNITITGLTNQNYDGTFAIRDILDEVSFTYRPTFETIKIDKVSIGKLRTADSKYPVTLYLSRKPNDDKYAYLPGQTKITISNMGSPYDGTFTISSQDLDAETPYITYLVDSATPHNKQDADYSFRKYGETLSVSKASYTRTTSGGKATGNGVATYKTPTAHSFVAGDTVVIANVGDVFTQKVGSANAYSELIVSIASVPNNTSFTTNNNGLYGINYNYDLSVGQYSVSEISPAGASVRKYDASSTSTNPLPPTLKIDDLPDVLTPVKNKVNVTDRAFNKDDRMVYLQLSSNPGLYKGGTIVVSGVDGSSESVFDGTFTIVGLKKREADNKWLVTYKSNNRSLKKDFGSFKDLTPKDKSKVRTFQAYEGNSGGTVSQETWVYVGSYGSYPGSTDIGIEFSTQAYSGHYMRSDRYKGHELKTVGEALATYADKFITRPGSTKSIRNIYGFDYRINCVYDYDTESFRRVFTFIPVHYPNEPLHGETSPISRFGADKVVFEYPGNIQSVSLKESSENASTRFWMVGSDGGTGTEDATKTYVGVAAKDLLNKNWPILESENSDDKLDYLVDISDRAYRYLSETQPPTGEFTVTVNGSLDPIVNTYQPSDWCSIIVNDPFVKERLLSDLEPRETVIVRKITAYTVDVPNNPSFPEQVSLTLIPEWDVDKRGQ